MTSQAKREKHDFCESAANKNLTLWQKLSVFIVSENGLFLSKCNCMPARINTESTIQKAEKVLVWIRLLDASKV